MSSPDVKIEYFYTEPEYLAASRLYLLGSQDSLVRLLILFVLIMIVALMITALVGDFPFWVAITLTLLVEAALLHAVMFVAPRRYFRGDGKFRDKYEVTFSNDGVAVKTKHIDSKVAWPLYTRVIEGPALYLLVYGNETRMMTMVPKRAFQSRVQEDQFRSLIAHHIGQHTRVGGTRSRNIPEPEYKPSSLNPPDWR